MTKTEFIEAVLAKLPDASRSQVHAFVDAYSLVAVEYALSKGEVTLPGIVKIELLPTPAKEARIGRNPFKGTAVTIPAKPAGKRIRSKFVLSYKIGTGVKEAKAAAAPRNKSELTRS